jgi:HEAT repeat protein
MASTTLSEEAWGNSLRNRCAFMMLLALTGGLPPVTALTRESMRSVVVPVESNAPQHDAGVNPKPRSVPQLVRRLRSSQEVERENAIVALGELGPQAVSAVPAILNTVARVYKEEGFVDQRRTYPIVDAAIAALVKMGSGAVPALIAAMDSKADALVRWVAAAALLETEPPPKTALPALERAVFRDDDDPNVSVYPSTPALAALARYGADAVPVADRLLDAKPSHFRTWGAHLVESLGPTARRTVPRLRERLVSGDRYEREAVMEALGGIGPDARAAIPELEQIQRTDDPQNRALAARTLAKIRGDVQPPPK